MNDKAVREDPFMSARYRWEENKNCVVIDWPLAAGSPPGKHVKTRFCKSAAFGSLATLLALALLRPAATHAAAPRYQLINLGSLGGTNYYETMSGLNGRYLNNSGTVVGGMDTSVTNPSCANCLTAHAFEWTNGFLADLGTLEFSPQGKFSQAFWVNDQGRSVGVSTYNAIGTNEPPYKAVKWVDRATPHQIIDLGTLGGSYSFAQAINNGDVAVGWALNLTPATKNIWEDYPYPFATQQRAVVWDLGPVAVDLGTLGGPSAWATAINDNGQIIGQSFTAVANGVPRHAAGWFFTRPQAGFIWENGKMTDLGNLGGTWALPIRINNQGQVIGYMTTPGDSSVHPFFWEQGVLKDLGTFGGSEGHANAINDAGEVVGGASSPNGFRAFLWKNGVMQNLGTLGPDSQAWAINSKTQVVGTSGNNDQDLRAFLWENGGPMLDLNELVPAGSPRLAVALAINDRGEIFCDGPNERGIYLLVPAPQLAIRFPSTAPPQTVAIDMKVVPGRHYSLEASVDLQSWTLLGTSFIAETNIVTRVLATSEGGRFYRLALIP
jgi:probable HAF family extracellular repeat protein